MSTKKNHSSSSSSPSSSSLSASSYSLPQLASAITRCVGSYSESPRKVANETNIPLSTIKHKRKEYLSSSFAERGGKIKGRILSFLIEKEKKREEKRHKLSEEQENDLHRFIEKRAEEGEPLSCAEIRLKAASIIGEAIPLSNKWFNRFIKRNNQLTARTPSTLTAARANALNQKTVNQFYDEIEKWTNEFALTGERIWNMDEKGFSGDSSIKGKKVYANKKQKHVNQIKKRCFTEHFTVLAIVSASGQSIPPVIAFEGTNVSMNMLNEKWEGIKITTQENGYLTQETLLSVIEHIDSSLSSLSRPLLLILDGSRTHFNPSALAVAREKGIHILCLPANTTHRLQPLDRSCFRSLSSFFRKECNSFRLSNNNQGIKKSDVLNVLKKAWDQAMTADNIRAGFRSCGIYPFDRLAIDPVEFSPSFSLSSFPPVNVTNIGNVNINVQISPVSSPIPSAPISNPPASSSADLMEEIKQLRAKIEKLEGEKKQSKKKNPSLSFKTTNSLLLTQPEIINQIALLQRERKEKEDKKTERKRKRESNREKNEENKENVSLNSNTRNTCLYSINLPATLSNGERKRVRLLF